MLKIVMLADDFTGALDTGIQFVQNGIEAVVTNDCNYDFSNVSKDTQLLAVNTASRHLPPAEAYKLVYAIAKRAHDCGVPILYKKTDSALRGCIGSELEAVLDASGVDELHFIPALPQAGRTTAGGVQYIDGIPIHETVFGKDPFEPVRCSDITRIIAFQSKIPVVVVPVSESPPPLEEGEKRIVIYDALTEADMKAAAETVKKLGGLNVIAGCSGLASVLPELIEFKHNQDSGIKKMSGVFFVSGSLNPITKAQFDFAEAAGFTRIHLSAEQKLSQDFLSSGSGKDFFDNLRKACMSPVPVILDTFSPEGLEYCDKYAEQMGLSTEQARERIAARLGEIMAEWLKFGFDYTVVTTGGDTLLGFMNATGCRELLPVCELSQGVVLSRIKLYDREMQIVSKSGGFGAERAMVDIAGSLTEKLIEYTVL